MYEFRDYQSQVNPHRGPHGLETNQMHRQHFKHALTIASNAQDNHMRALILALISCHYFHTASEHAVVMLKTCGQLAAGLGAAGNKETIGDVGNAQMRLWVGERFLGE
jgi:hypothetical protein